nr:hypothetical protein [Synechococcus sp. PROS-7-1]
MGLQHLSINPGIANPKRPRPAVGDQVQHTRRMALRSSLRQRVRHSAQPVLIRR